MKIAYCLLPIAYCLSPTLRTSATVGSCCSSRPTCAPCMEEFAALRSGSDHAMGDML